MNSRPSVLVAVCLFLARVPGDLTGAEPARETETKGAGARGVASPTQGQVAGRGRYRLEQGNTTAKSTVLEFSVSFGANENGPEQQWIELEATKASGEQFRVWVQSPTYPPATLAEAEKVVTRYLLQEGTGRAAEFRDRFTHLAALPTMAGWTDLFPQPILDEQKKFVPAVRYLGHRYRLQASEEGARATPPRDPRVIDLLPEALIGVASNTRQKDERRRYDNSDYELVRLTRNDYHEMAEAGMNCFKVDAEQLPWVADLGAFYWGPDGSSLPYPECLYRSTYLGPTLFVDEPAVGTRDYVIRPRLEKENSFKKEITPQIVFEAFQTHFRQALEQGAPQQLANSLKSRTDVDLGEMQLKQANLFSWETMVSTAAYQLSQDPQVPAAMVFEPPGRVGTLRTVPELDMTYGCQLPVADPGNLIDIIYGFLRGAARLTDKSWGTSIYGSVDRTDAFWFLTHAYDLGATRFFFWDNARSACVPYGECLALARNLRAHVENYPARDIHKLNLAAEVAIFLPAGYNLGHVQLGKGNLWGLSELNLERKNRAGVPYRTVMSNFFSEIERCLRQGIAFDLLWDLPGLPTQGYREVIHVREDGKVQVKTEDGESVVEGPRAPSRPGGAPPDLQVEVSAAEGKAPLSVRARAVIVEKSAPVYYTHGVDSHGISRNAYVMWELYGPDEENYHFLNSDGSKADPGGRIELTTHCSLGRPGSYRLRVATVDLAGRSTVVWKRIQVSE